jgi:hypothetical protein
VVSSRRVGSIRLYQDQGAPYGADTASRLAARRAVQRVALRRAARGAGSDLVGLLNRRVVLGWWGVADKALTEVRHAAVGDVAAAAYMPGRQTDDIDIAVAARDVATAETLFRRPWLDVRPPSRPGRGFGLARPRMGMSLTSFLCKSPGQVKPLRLPARIML